MKHIILISGKAESGKDTFTDLIIKHMRKSKHKFDILRINFADQLKHDLAKYFDTPVNKGSVSYRSMMQFIGTDIVRKQRPNFWVDNVIAKIGLYNSMFDVAIISDARFKNEMDLVEEFANKSGYKFTTIRVVRDGHKSSLTRDQSSHKSETDLDDYLFEYKVLNNTNIMALNEDAEAIFEDLFA